MDYLARESADLPVELWNRIDDAVIGTARKHLTCRRFLKLFGPLGPGATSVAVDGVAKEEVLEDGIGRIVGRTRLELPMFYEDFTLLGRDLERADQTGIALDLAPAVAAAKKSARREDDLILNGNKALGIDGLLTVKGSSKIKKGDWAQGEHGFADVAAAVAQLAKTGYLGRYALVVSPDLYLDLQRLQPNTGMLEIDRVQKLIGDNVYMTSVMGAGKAVLVCAEPEYVDLAVGLPRESKILGMHKPERTDLLKGAAGEIIFLCASKQIKTVFINGKKINQFSGVFLFFFQFLETGKTDLSFRLFLPEKDFSFLITQKITVLRRR